MSALAYDGTAMLGRQLRRVRNNPALVILTQTMPITMLLFFGYVFGSALAMPGDAYRSYLVPGLLVATAANGIMTGMFQAAQDSHRGVTDRFRTLPMSRAAVPLGQATADLVVTAAGTVPFLLVGLAVGWRIEGSALQAAAAVGLLLLFRFACAWVGILLGLPPAARRRPVSSAARPSCCRCCPTRTSRRTGCRAGCAPWPSGTRSAR
jgi:ABC-2 type transport system permease protein